MSEIIILIPSLDPDEKLISLIEKLQKETNYKIVVVDDGSSDKSSVSRLKEEKMCYLITHAVNQGKGRALKTGINFILTTFPNCTGIVTADSDGQHTIEGIRKVASVLKKNPNNLILGSRNFTKQNIPFRSRFGNTLTIKIFNFFSDINVHDTQTGLRGIPREYMKNLLNVSGERFEFEMHMLMECKTNNISVKEIPIETVYIEGNKSSHFNPLVDSVKIYFVFFKYILSSVLTAVVDFVVFYMAINLGANLALAMFIGRFIASITNFTINKTAVFKSNNKISSEIMKYYALVFLSGVTSYYIIKVLSMYFFSMNMISSKIIAESVLFFINYYVQNHYVFKFINNGK